MRSSYQLFCGRANDILLPFVCYELVEQLVCRNDPAVVSP